MKKPLARLFTTVSSPLNTISERRDVCHVILIGIEGGGGTVDPNYPTCFYSLRADPSPLVVVGRRLRPAHRVLEDFLGLCTSRRRDCRHLIIVTLPRWPSLLDTVDGCQWRPLSLSLSLSLSAPPPPPPPPRSPSPQPSLLRTHIHVHLSL